MKQKYSHKVVVLDNGGITVDRYTIIERKTAEVYGCSNEPFAPNGFGCYSHNITMSKFNLINATESQNRCAVNIYLRDIKLSLGKRVKDLTTLPADVQKYIQQIIS